MTHKRKTRPRAPTREAGPIRKLQDHIRASAVIGKPTGDHLVARRFPMPKALARVLAALASLGRAYQ